MNAQIAAVVVTAAVSIATTLVAVFYGPSWKDRIEARRASRQRSEKLLARYSEPLARAAFELQSRLYNICRQALFTDSRTSVEYRRLSTLWLFGQFLAWVEIVRREVQVIDVGDIRRTARLQRHLFDVADILSSGGLGDDLFRVLRADQRAIGELMVIERSGADQGRSDSMGYAEFTRRVETDRAFSRWFSCLAANIHALQSGGQVGVRAVLIQRALIDLIDFFDPEHVRFPDPNERGRLPLPPGQRDRKRLRPASEVARFRFEADPFPTVESWARERGLAVTCKDGIARTGLPRRRPGVRHDVVVLRVAQWVEIHVVRRAAQPDNNAGRPAPALRGSETDALNMLLERFDRPPLPARRLRLRDVR
jgi:hypothetical protein